MLNGRPFRENYITRQTRREMFLSNENPYINGFGGGTETILVRGRRGVF